MQSQIPEINKVVDSFSEVLAIPTFASINPGVFKALAKSSVPFIYKQEFNRDIINILSRSHGNNTVDIRTGDYANPQNYISVENRKYIKLSLAEYLANPSVGYLGNYKISENWLAETKITPPNL